MKTLKKLWRLDLFLSHIDKMIWGTGSLAAISWVVQLWTTKTVSAPIFILVASSLFVIRVMLLWIHSGIKTEIKYFMGRADTYKCEVDDSKTLSEEPQDINGP